MSFDCIIFKSNQDPFIHEVNSESSDFDIVYLDREVYESFSIERIEEKDHEDGRIALYLVANKSGVEREFIIEAIRNLKPRPVRHFD